MPLIFPFTPQNSNTCHGFSPTILLYLPLSDDP